MKTLADEDFRRCQARRGAESAHDLRGIEAHVGGATAR
jgi:hypothetical protein